MKILKIVSCEVLLKIRQLYLATLLYFFISLWMKKSMLSQLVNLYSRFPSQVIHWLGLPGNSDRSVRFFRFSVFRFLRYGLRSVYGRTVLQCSVPVIKLRSTFLIRPSGFWGLVFGRIIHGLPFFRDGIFRSGSLKYGSDGLPVRDRKPTNHYYLELT